MFMAHFIAFTMHSCMSVAIVAMTDKKSNRKDVPVCILDICKHKQCATDYRVGSVKIQPSM